MFYVTGDTHAEWLPRFGFQAFPEGRELTKQDYVLVLGDFGIWDQSKREKQDMDWLENRPWTTLFIDGNHENYDILDAMPVKEWKGGKTQFIRPSVIHLMRGQLFDIDGIKLWTFGGARSHDIRDGILEPGDPRIKEWRRDEDTRRQYRINHVSWWEHEMPTEEEMEEGRENLRKAGNKVDIIATHCPYSSLLRKIDREGVLYPTNYLSDYLQEVYDITDFSLWLSGHVHIDQKFVKEKTVCLYEQIVPLTRN